MVLVVVAVVVVVLLKQDGDVNRGLGSRQSLGNGNAKAQLPRPDCVLRADDQPRLESEARAGCGPAVHFLGGEF